MWTFGLPAGPPRRRLSWTEARETATGFRGLIEEALSSSQLEGASTTRVVARQMLRSGRRPRDKSERMIFNNYHAINFIKEATSENLTPGLLLEIARSAHRRHHG